jgi:hypothetical protein
MSKLSGFKSLLNKPISGHQQKRNRKTELTDERFLANEDTPAQVPIRQYIALPIVHLNSPWI